MLQLLFEDPITLIAPTQGGARIASKPTWIGSASCKLARGVCAWRWRRRQ